MPTELCVRRQPLMAALLAVMACLIALSLIDAIGAFEHALVVLAMDRIRLDSERSISAFFSFTTLLIAFGLLAVIAIFKTRRGDRWMRHWVGLACLFLFLAYDEAASFHEMLIDPLRQAFDLGGFLYFAWVIPGAVLVTIVFLVYLPFLKSLERRYALLFLTAGGLYVGGALGMELVSGPHFHDGEYDHRFYHLLTTFEETLEMGGTLLFIHTLLRYLEEPGSAREVRIRFEPGDPAGPVPAPARPAPGRSVGERPAP